MDNRNKSGYWWRNITYLKEKNYDFIDLGCDGESCDYPNIAKAVSEKITNGEVEKGILICGTGIGMSIAANKIKGIRASLCSDSFSTRFTRLHNDSNVMCIGARVIGTGLALELLEIFLTTEYEGGRHQKRLDIIKNFE